MLELSLTQDYVRLLRLLLQELRTVQIPVHKPYVRILATYLGAFVAVANKTRNIIRGMSTSDLIKGIAAYIAGSTESVSWC